MALSLYNTLTRRVEPFEPLTAGKVSLYVCGPTVYDDPHIGHARSAYVFDVLRRWLARTHEVTFVRNVTDVDDKIIHKAQETGETPEAVAEKYLQSYHAMLERLGIMPPTHEPRATQHLDVMQEMIAKLCVDGIAYEAAPPGARDKDVYFAVRRFAGYGQLSNRTLDDLQVGTRVEPGEHKRDPLDFALWKAAKPSEPSWSSPWGAGRPGWHIECSAMSTKYLGDQFDIHGGGLDLIFPHHENEIAQAQAAGKPFAKYWIHNGLLTINGQKMSKSLGNFVTVDAAIGACHGSVDAFKVFLLSSHYRSPVDYTSTNIAAAYNRWRNLIRLIENADHECKRIAEWRNTDIDIARLEQEASQNEQIHQVHLNFEKAMNDDLNTPRALACLDELVNLANGWRKQKLPALGTLRYPDQKEGVARIEVYVIAAGEKMRQLAGILGLELDADTDEEASSSSASSSSSSSSSSQSSSTISSGHTEEEIEELIDRRNQARQQKKFAEADQIRQQLATDGILLEDMPDGTIWRRKR